MICDFTKRSQIIWPYSSYKLKQRSGEACINRNTYFLERSYSSYQRIILLKDDVYWSLCSQGLAYHLSRLQRFYFIYPDSCPAMRTQSKKGVFPFILPFVRTTLTLHISFYLFIYLFQSPHCLGYVFKSS